MPIHDCSHCATQEERLAECERYRAFLDAITPASHFEALAAKRAAARDARSAAWRAECEAIEERKAAAARAAAQAEHDFSNARTQQEADRAAEGIKAAAATLKAALAVRPPPQVVEEAPEAEDTAARAAAADGSAMFFTAPQQLLDILSELEAENLFLIQNAQEVEEALDSLEDTYKCAAWAVVASHAASRAADVFAPNWTDMFSNAASAPASGAYACHCVLVGHFYRVHRC
jgi:hypothetical protein